MQNIETVKFVPRLIQNSYPLGTKYGRLTVVGYRHIFEKDKGRWKVVCKCDCGNETVTRPGIAESCGCLQRDAASRMGKEHGGWKLLPKGEAAFRFLLRDYVRGASERRLEFCLTPDQFKALTQKPCWYCGQKPSAVVNRPELNGPYYYNGIDRIDSTKGYSTENAVPCCSVCNRAKFTMTAEKFIEWLHQASGHCRIFHTTTE